MFEQPLSAAALRELQALLEQEVAQLPEKYRAPFLLCCLQGKSRAEAAQELGWKEGTVSGRLAKARTHLRQRLARRGIALPAALCAIVLRAEAGKAAAPAALVVATSKAGVLWMAGAGAAQSAVSPRVAALVQAASGTTMLSRLSLSILLVALGVAGGGLGLLTYEALAAKTWHESESVHPDPPAVAAEPAAETRQQAGDGEPSTDYHGDPLPPGVVARLGTMRLRPGGSIQHLAFSPDGKRLASWHEEMYVTNTLTIWDAADGRELRRVDLQGIKVAHWQWLADGRGIAVLAVDGEQYLWEFTDEAAKPPKSRLPAVRVALARPAGNQNSHTRFAVSPDGKRLVGSSGSQAGKECPIDVWDMATGKKVSELPRPQLLAMQPDNCSALFFTPDGRRLIAFSPIPDERHVKEYRIVVWDATTGKEERQFTNAAPLCQGGRMSVALSNQLLALGMEDEPATVALWDLATGQSRSLTTKHVFRPNNGFGISAIAFTPDGQTLVTAGRGGEIKLWEAATLREIREIPQASLSWIEALTVSAAGKMVASGGQDHVIRLWDLATGKERGPNEGLAGNVTGVRLSADGKIALTFCADGTLRLWDAATGRPQRALAIGQSNRSWPRGELAPDGRTVLTSAGGRLAALDIVTCKEKKLPELPSDLACDSIRFGADGKTLIALAADKISLLDWPTAKARRTVTLPPPEKKPGDAHADAADISPDGRWLITLAHRSRQRQERGMNFGFESDSVLDLWNAATGEHVRRLLASQGVGHSVLYTAHGDVVLAGSGTLKGVAGDNTELGGQLNLIDPLTGRLKHTFTAAPSRPGIRAADLNYITSTALSADGRLLFTGSHDGSVVAYETLTGQVRQTLAGYRGYVMDLAGSKDGRRLIGGGGGLNALVWDVSLAGAAPAGPAPAQAEQALLWDQLLDPKPEVALPAMRRLAAHPEVAVAVLRDVLKPIVSAPDSALLDRLVQELGDRKFAIREQASRRLDELGESAVVGLKTRLANVSDPEVQTRLMRLLAKYDPVTATPDLVREARALEILEQVDTPAARALLKELAGGAANARRTKTAADALRRLER